MLQLFAPSTHFIVPIVEEEAWDLADRTTPNHFMPQETLIAGNNRVNCQPVARTLVTFLPIFAQLKERITHLPDYAAA